MIFFDTETTGNTEKDFLCQIAYKCGEESFVGLYKPPIKIPPEASAIHHITNKMVVDKPTFKESTDQPIIKKLFEDKDSIIVAHNAPFDLLIISKEDIVPRKFICTLRVARYLDKEGKIERYNLQYLRYLLELEIEATAHDALGDVLVLEKLFERLKNKMIEEIAPTPNGVGVTTENVVKKMIEVSSHPSLMLTFNFGKHLGKKVEEVLKTDRGYLEWLLAQKLEGDQIEDDWIYTLKHHLKK
ncbi:MAG: Exonuclease RNase T and DNA polymerase III [Candidatus Nomurabacteria bacterium GW2011_GWF2_43_8]|uniref:Exonuclease RNase T and DNA polymerase III n=1 Tax=Candidatus Nomurabacteria bacterium GW2011_GWF2_43_8 TaxID=1618779 RepID=A0A0G1HZF5_9BACT|nr:MAG: Exonuclease RNase T and DNA polymerase III [Candidatus Nomurabacteria bacterium GW2011_GWF2_43_8]